MPQVVKVQVQDIRPPTGGFIRRFPPFLHRLPLPGEDMARNGRQLGFSLVPPKSLEDCAQDRRDGNILRLLLLGVLYGQVDESGFPVDLRPREVLDLAAPHACLITTAHNSL